MKYYSSNEQIFLKKILDEIFTSNEGYTTSIVCINYNSQVSKSFTKTEASSTLRKLVEDKWLTLKDGKIFIGVRGRIELEPFFKVEYGEYMASCELCREITLIGYSCRGCEKAFHNLCIEKYFHTVRTDPYCPSCKTTWNDVRISDNFNFDHNGNINASANQLNLPSTSSGGSTERTAASRSSDMNEFDFLAPSTSGLSQISTSTRTKRHSRDTCSTNGGSNVSGIATKTSRNSGKRT